MNRKQRDQNRKTAAYLAEELFEASLPDGLYMRGNIMTYNCTSCDRECEWYGTPAEFDEPHAIKVGGCSPYCLP